MELLRGACCFFVSFYARAKVPRIFLRTPEIRSAPHLSTQGAHTVPNGRRPGAGLQGTGVQWAIFSCYLLRCELHMLSRQASFGCLSNSGQPGDMHLSQLPGQPAAQSSSQDGGNENSATWPATMPASKLHLSCHCLGYSELGLLTLHGNTGTKDQLEGFKCLAKVARKVSSSAFCFHNGN